MTFSWFYMTRENDIKWKVVSSEGREASKGKLLKGPVLGWEILIYFESHETQFAVLKEYISSFMEMGPRWDQMRQEAQLGGHRDDSEESGPNRDHSWGNREKGTATQSVKILHDLESEGCGRIPAWETG